MGGFTVHFRSFNQVKVKKVCLTEWPFILLAQKTCCKDDIIIAINELLNLALSSIQHFWSTKMQERLIKIQLVPINKSYLKIRNTSALSKL